MVLKADFGACIWQFPDQRQFLPVGVANDSFLSYSRPFYVALGHNGSSLSSLNTIEL